MAMKIRLARGGSKKRPYYSIVAADSRMPRDGRFLEKLGTYNPLLPKDSEDRVRIDLERVQHWLDRGAQPTDRVSRFLEAAGAAGKKERANLKKGEPHAKAKERAEERAAKAAAPVEEPAAAAVDETVAEETVADETAAEESPAAEDTAAEETVAEESPATEDTAAEEAPADDATKETASE